MNIYPNLDYHFFIVADLEKRIEVRNKFPKEIVSKDMEFNQDNINAKVKTKVYAKR